MPSEEDEEDERTVVAPNSSFDKCLYYVRDEEGKLCGVLVVHVDDTASGGVGKHYESVVQHFRRRFPFRKWQQHKGEYNGAFYEQDPVTKTISMHQKVFAEEKLRPIRLSRSRMSNRDGTATDAEISAFRGTYGGGNWLASQSRPDLSVMVSLVLQCMPRPTVAQLTEANTMVRRAKQFSDLTIMWKPIPFSDLTAVLHTDASWGKCTTAWNPGGLHHWIHDQESQHWRRGTVDSLDMAILQAATRGSFNAFRGGSVLGLRSRHVGVGCASHLRSTGWTRHIARL